MDFKTRRGIIRGSIDGTDYSAYTVSNVASLPPSTLLFRKIIIAEMYTIYQSILLKLYIRRFPKKQSFNKLGRSRSISQFIEFIS